MTDIEQWLSGERDYNAGVILYQNYGSNHNLKKAFWRGPDDYNLSKLPYELDLIKHEGKPVQVITEVKVSEVRQFSNEQPAKVYNENIVPEKPEKYHEIHKQALLFYKEASHIHQTQLRSDLPVEQRAKAVMRIMELFNVEINPRFALVDYFSLHGKWPEEEQEEKELSQGELLSRRNTLRTYISKFANHGDKIQKVEAWKAEMEKIEAKLNADAGSVRVQYFLTTQLSKMHDKIKDILTVPQPGECEMFFSGGRWSTHDLINYFIKITGPCKVYITTYALSDKAATTLINLFDSGLIQEFYCILDARMKVRNPNVLSLINHKFSNIKQSNCHAKVTVLQNENYNLVIIGSANHSNNPRIEVGTIFNDAKAAQFCIDVIIDELNHRKPFGR